MKKLIAFLKNPWVTRIYLLILITWVATVIYSQRDAFQEIVKTSRLQMIFFAVLSYFVVVGILNPYLHRVAYKRIGTVITFWQAFRIFHLSRIGNYLPGRVWFATNYYLFSKKMNIDTENIAKNFVVMNIALILTGSICTLPIFSFMNLFSQKILIIFTLLMMLVLHPKILNRIFSFVGINKTSAEFGYLFLIQVCILYIVAYIILGLTVYFCVSAFKAVSISRLPFMTGVAASFVITILLAIFAPAGIGVGESIGAIILSNIIPAAVAITVVIALRMVMIAVDVSCALISAISVSREDKFRALADQSR